MLKDEFIKKYEEFVASGKSRCTLYTAYGSIPFFIETSKVGDARFEYNTNNNYSAILYESINSIRAGEPMHIHGSARLGCDPEFFFVKDGKVVPSNLVVKPNENNTVTEDGFQGELNPPAMNCRVHCGQELHKAINRAHDMAKEAGAQLSFAVGHVITDDVWKSVPMKTKRFGCNPTVNVHPGKVRIPTGIRERFRSAGGHVHLGCGVTNKETIEKIVRVLDIILGNTCVLLDRDESNARRRKIYGRAGEYRKKSYGLEYRVLSNFWIRHYVLMSFVYATARQAVGYVVDQPKIADKLIASFDMKDIRDAINNNDYDLAMKNFLIYKKFVEENNIYSSSGLSLDNIDNFLRWVNEGDILKNLSVDTDDGVIKTWNTYSYDHVNGFEQFIRKK